MNFLYFKLNKVYCHKSEYAVIKDLHNLVDHGKGKWPETGA